MRVLVVGAGRVGAAVLLQLKKNPNIEVLTVDPREDPYAVERKIIPDVDFHEALTPNALEYVIAQTKPDLVLVTTAAEDMGFGRAPGIDILVEALREELAATADVPVIAVARTALR
jgi:dTDP-4-dehydrorhamnose reductase